MTIEENAKFAKFAKPESWNAEIAGHAENGL